MSIPYILGLLCKGNLGNLPNGTLVELPFRSLEVLGGFRLFAASLVEALAILRRVVGYQNELELASVVGVVVLCP